jgi:uncharacterized protein
MARRFFRRFIPHPERVRRGRIVGALGRVLHQPSLWHLNRHSASRGVAVGVFWSFVPIPGQTLWSALSAIKARGNVALAVLVPWAATFVQVPVFYASYRLGLLILRQPQIEDFWQHLTSWNLRWLWTQRSAILPLMVGSAPVASALAVGSFFLVQWFWRWNLNRRWQRRAQRLKAEAASRASRQKVQV